MDEALDLRSEFYEASGDGFVLDPERCYRALVGRDRRLDGRFFVGVKTTGIFCRPICPAPKPKAINCTYWPSAAAAQQAGFRPCLRCRPEVAPGTPAWQGTAASVTRALRLIEEGALDSGGRVEPLANRLGIGPRHLRRLFDQHLGTTPQAVAKLRRAFFAKQLISETGLSMTEVALASGFSSQRRFNACIQEVFHQTPTHLRSKGQRRGSSDRSKAETRETVSPTKTSPRMIEMGLAYRPPFAWKALLDFLRPRAIPGVESVGEVDYARSFRQGTAVGSLRVTEQAARSRLRVEVRASSVEALIGVTTGLRRLFDVDADAEVIDAQMARMACLRGQVKRVPGMRVPGAFDGFETAVRAILGQQISVKGATTFAGRIAMTEGEGLPPELSVCESITRIFPPATALVSASLEEIGLTRRRAETIRGLALAVSESPRLMQPGGSLALATADWEALSGIGPWTAHYVAMRVLQESDALPIGDLGLRKAVTGREQRLASEQDVEKALEVCRPYRAYAALRLWAQLSSA